MKTKQFKISEVLRWQPQKEIDPLKINELTVDANYTYPFYGQSTLNNGIISYETLTSKVLNNKDDYVSLPVDSNNNLDFNTMEQLITIQEKLAIESIVKWKDKIINTSKKCI